MSYIREGFQYTGRSVQLDPEASSSHVIALLDDYNKRLKRGESQRLNPFKERVIMRNDDGIFYEIPKEIQDHAIQLWTNKNNVDNIDDANDTDDSDNEDKPNKNNMLIYIILLIIAIGLGYYVTINCSSCSM